MKKSDFKMVIRKIVREEVAMAIQEVITEMKEPLQQINTVHAGEIRKTTPKKKKVVEKKNFSSNSVLNDVLNETANSEWETLGGGTQTSKNMNNVLQNQYSDLMAGGNNVPLPQTDINDRPVTNVSNDLMNNLTKDYSKTLKAMEKSANKSRGI
tara:strand:+ start:1096 stop:1557 length:462 start_codon:yes stop_codon:yes gene_type:complete